MPVKSAGKQCPAVAITAATTCCSIAAQAEDAEAEARALTAARPKAGLDHGRLDGQRMTRGPCGLARRAGKFAGLRFAIRWPDGRARC